MALSRGVNLAITGAGNADTGLKVLTGMNVYVSAGATLNLRDGSSTGTIVAQTVLAGAGNWAPLFPPEGVRAQGTSKTWFITNSAGNISGGAFGY